MNTTFFTNVAIAGLLVGSITSCHPYAGTRNMHEKVVMSYGKGSIIPPKQKTADGKEKMGTLDMVTGLVIGYVFKQVSKEVEKRRDGDFKVENAALYADSTFPNDGFVIVLRVVRDNKDKYPDVASVDDFLNNRNDSVAAQLRSQIVSSRGASTFRVTQEQLSTAVRKALPEGSYKAQDRIAYLAICPLFPIANRPSDADPLYAVGLEGIYYPLFKGNRFSLERQGLVRKFTDSKEVMNIELYGPNGSGFSTGVIPIPVLWSPPSSGKMWVTAEDLIKDLPEKQQALIKKMMDLNYEKSTNRGTFMEARRGVIPLIKGDAYVDESGDGTKWLLKGLEELENTIEP